MPGPNRSSKHNGLFRCDPDRARRIIDVKGRILSKDYFERARPFRAGLAPVMKDRRWGFVDTFRFVLDKAVLRRSTAARGRPGIPRESAAGGA